MGLSLQIAETGHANDFTFLNFTGTDIPANYLVQVDTTYYNSATQTVDGIGIVLPSAGGVRCIGVTMEIIRAGSAVGTPAQGGRVRCFGPLAWAISTGVIAIGGQVMADNTTPGFVKAYATSAIVLGIALTQAAVSTDPILIMLTAGQVAV